MSPTTLNNGDEKPYIRLPGLSLLTSNTKIVEILEMILVATMYLTVWFSYSSLMVFIS